MVYYDNTSLLFTGEMSRAHSDVSGTNAFNNDENMRNTTLIASA